MNARLCSRIFSIVLALVLVLSLLPKTQSSAEPARSNPDGKEFRVGTEKFAGEFSPFFRYNGADQELLDLVNLKLLTYDRTGYIISDAIEGETVNYNGTDYCYTGPADVSVEYREDQDVTVYTARLREDLKFWDGEPVTAKDLLFTYYTLLDPAYEGPYPLKSYDIVGLRSWMMQTSDELYEYYRALAEKIRKDGEGQGYVANETYTEEQYNDYYGFIDEGWTNTLQGICRYILEKYLNEQYEEYALSIVGKTTEEISSSDGLKMAYVMGMWGFGNLDETGMFVDCLGLNSWDLVNSFPTLEDFKAVTKAVYNNDPVAFYNTETSGEDYGPIVDYARDQFIRKYGRMAMNGEKIISIIGVRMPDDYTVELTLNGYDGNAIYDLFDIPVVPMHYYGDPAKWDPENGLYGFEEGNLELQTAVSLPRGAGPYVFESCENGVVTLSANPNWYKGEPKLETIRFDDRFESDELISAIQNNEIDAAFLYGSQTACDAIRECNSNHALTGDQITTNRINTLNYGYIGLNAQNVSVNGKPGSDASKALRKALSTMLAVYRDEAYASYFGDMAAIIDYPIAADSWAAPRPNDPGYTEAFSKDANGNDIYTDGMTQQERCAAAKAAALTWFRAAGYTVSGGSVVSAPAGGSTVFEVMIPGGGMGDHPSYQLVSLAREALASIGIDLQISDCDFFTLMDEVYTNRQQLWGAALGETVEPNFYDKYHSDNIIGRNGYESNFYSIEDEALDELIDEAARLPDQGLKKDLYKQCLDLIMDWGVVLPCYQRQNFFIFSTERIDAETITQDPTSFWDWKDEVERLDVRHQWDNGVTVPPSCTEDGYVLYTCLICGDTYTEILPALGHSFDRAVCTRCGYEAQAAYELFGDVKPGRWYEDAVLWAVQNGITTGTGEREFSPNDICTRAQVMTFLWHAEGDPNPSVPTNPFTDNREGKWYYNAVLWAYHHDPQITSGSTPTLFGISNGCTREQVVTFLWKAAGEPEPVTTENPFTDVKEGKWYYKAVLWAYENQITSGIDKDLFGVHSTCTRAQIVTFLYKSYG